mgnify:CR=1 FL=1
MGTVVSVEKGEAVVTAGAFAAFLSTSSGLTMSIAGVLHQDLRRRRTGRARPDTLRGFRSATVAAISVPLALAVSSGSLSLADALPLVRDRAQAMQDAVAVAFETGAERIGCLVDRPMTCAVRPGGVGGQCHGLVVFACWTSSDHGVADRGRGVGVCNHDVVAAVPGHRGGPPFGAFLGRIRVREFGHEKTIRDGPASGALASKKCRSSSTSAN